MTTSIDIQINGVDLRLFASRAAYSDRHETLFVSDTHLGKDATFRHFGIPVPSGACRSTIGRLSELILQTSPKQLVILGDLFHARSSLSTSVCQSMDEFFSAHHGLPITLVRGNHDRHVGRLPSHWPIEVVERGARIGSIALLHEPCRVPDDSDVLLCGHLHPAIHIKSSRDALGRLPCFWLSAGRLVFPAFGDFTGTHNVRLENGDRAWAIAADTIVECTARRSSRDAINSSRR